MIRNSAVAPGPVWDPLLLLNRAQLQGANNEPLAEAVMEIRPGRPEEDILKVNCANALAVDGQCGQVREEDWFDPAALDQRTLYQGNTTCEAGSRRG